MTTLAEIKPNAERKMGQSIDAFKTALQRVRTGRPSPQLLDVIHVDYYGAMLPLSQVANLNPASQGDLIRVPMPAMTEERRKELTKVVRSEGEDAKIAIRNLRRDANETVKRLVKDKEASEDDERRQTDEIQKLTDKFISEVDNLVEAKEADILAV